MEDLIDRLNSEFGLQIFAELLGFTPQKNGQKVRLFDNTRTSQDYFYLKGKRLYFPHVHNFSSGETYTPITAYAKAHGLTNSEAVKELKAKYILDISTPKRTYQTPKVVTPKKPTLEIDANDFAFSVQNAQNSNLLTFLRHAFGNEATYFVRKCYVVGSTKAPHKYDTAFWYCDKDRKPLNAKLMAYNASNGKRNKNIAPNWYHAVKGKENTNFGFFGEHLEAETIWIVESEKTALIVTAYLFLNNVTDIAVWACGGRQFLKSRFEQSTQNLQGKRFILVPDCDTENKDFSEWQSKANEISQSLGIDIEISTYLMETLTYEQKAQKYDVADVIVKAITGHNELTEFIEKDIEFCKAYDKEQIHKRFTCKYPNLMIDFKQFFVEVEAYCNRNKHVFNSDTTAFMIEPF
ncbi:MAG: DUF6371 domain-containing protein [Raineya sp.]|nr:DUF6371 domain-containing protein [Raineya sp.]